jgi:hypothetical protein
MSDAKSRSGTAATAWAAGSGDGGWPARALSAFAMATSAATTAAIAALGTGLRIPSQRAAWPAGRPVEILVFISILGANRLVLQEDA